MLARRRPTRRSSLRWCWRLAKISSLIGGVACVSRANGAAAFAVFSIRGSRLSSSGTIYHGRFTSRTLARASSSSSDTGVNISTKDREQSLSSSSSSLLSESSTDNPSSSSSCSWIREGLLLSSFTDGLSPANSAARACLQRGLVRVLLQEQQRNAETRLESSAVTSPCCGPNTDALEHLEAVDRALERLLPDSPSADGSDSNPLEILRDVTNSEFGNSIKDQQQQHQQLELRMVYIPTAMYALRPESKNTPGKQRQRARADGKKRRSEIVKLLQEELPGIPIRAVTLDLDDGSVKQPESTTTHNNSVSPSAAAAAAFPATGEQALGDWAPHLVYVQGGNTFWLYHCLVKGNWRDRFVRLLERGDTFYCGASAGAIVVGASMQTACWKGWDDPRVVPGMETYDDWQTVAGLRMCGSSAFFPHYIESEWSEVVRANGAKLKDETRVETWCLRDDQVCLVDGSAKRITVF